MTSSDIKEFIRCIMNNFKGYQPDRICRRMTITEGLRKTYPKDEHNANNIYYMVLANGLLHEKDNGFVSLTKDGYDYISEGKWEIPPVHLEILVPLYKNRERLFYELLGFIGYNEKDNPYYVKEDDFYDAIKDKIEGIPPSYTQFATSLSVKSGETSISKQDCFNKLFSMLTEVQVGPFLRDLSSLINSRLNQFEILIDNERNNMISNKVFIVHGHDNLKLEVEFFLMKLGLEPIILHKQASKGNTIIEKIEDYTNVGYGIVLYTPDDEGRLKESKEGFSPRARQNVVFEHGYLVGKLGRGKVCALVDKGVETPGDIDGIVYVLVDDSNSWKFELAKEIKAAGLHIDANKLLEM